MAEELALLHQGRRANESGDDQANDPDKTEYFVRIRWLAPRPKDQAFHEVSLLGQQNSACKPNAQKWRDTIGRLKSKFTQWNRE